jgi:uncharacterized membrane protein (UPF0127 family)
MNKYLILLLSFFLISCATTPEVNTDSSPPSESINNQENLGQQLPVEATLAIADQMIELEIAKTPQQQQIGLMYRTFLDDNRGMLFPFSPPRRVSFWMKNVAIDLDMIFLRNGVIESIESNVPPCQADPCPTYGPNVEIDQVIELRGSRATELGLQEGDSLEINFLN